MVIWSGDCGLKSRAIGQEWFLLEVEFFRVEGPGLFVTSEQGCLRLVGIHGFRCHVGLKLK